MLVVPVGNARRCYALVLYGGHEIGTDLDASERHLLGSLARDAEIAYAQVESETLAAAGRDAGERAREDTGAALTSPQSMPMTHTPRSLDGVQACVFDAYGTLFDFASAAARCPDVPEDRRAALTALWRDKQLQYSLAAHAREPLRRLLAGHRRGARFRAGKPRP